MCNSMTRIYHKQAVIGTLYGNAILSAAGRATLRFYQQQGLHLDDAFLGFALLALTAGTGFVFSQLSNIYLSQKLIEGHVTPEGVALLRGVNTGATMLWIQRARYIHAIIFWLVIYSVKFSFLFFFSHLVSRVHCLTLYWRVIFVINIIAFVFCLCSSFIGCPYTNLTSRK